MTINSNYDWTSRRIEWLHETRDRLYVQKMPTTGGRRLFLSGDSFQPFLSQIIIDQVIRVNNIVTSSPNLVLSLRQGNQHGLFSSQMQVWTFYDFPRHVFAKEIKVSRQQYRFHHIEFSFLVIKACDNLKNK